jgi:chromosome partitioning protein
MSKIITIAGQKGGTGKSITAVNLAASFALFEKKTLLIDCDPQGCSTQWTGISKKDYNCDIASILSGRSKVVDAIVNTNLDYLDIIPAGFTLFNVALKLAKNPGNEKLLRLFLQDIQDTEQYGYEYIIIDPPSSHSFLSVSAMTASDFLLVCMSAQYNCLEDFHGLLKMVKHIKANHKVHLKIAGFLFNRCETKKQIKTFLTNHKLLGIEQMVFDNFIPEDDNIQKTIDLKVPVLLNDIKSKAATAYLNFAQELHFFFN